MSLGVAAAIPRAPLGRRLALAAAAVAAAVLLLAALSALVAPEVAPPQRSPFGVGFREAAPAATGLAGRLLAVQASFSKSLQAALMALRAGGDWLPLAVLGFAYGVFHAAGPGHGKAVIAGYIVAGERSLRRGCTLSFAAALLQAAVAIGLVGVGSLLLGATAATLSRAGNLIESASFALVAVLGLALTWRKAGRLAQGTGATCGPNCGHAAAAAPRPGETWRTRAGVVLAAGSRPCAGAVLLLVLALSQGLLWAGVLAVLAMALGTALTTTALASLAVFAKGLALRLAGGRGQAGARAVGALELVAAACVMVLGLAMLAGLLAGTGGA